MHSYFEVPRSADPGVRLDLDRALRSLSTLQRHAVEAIFLCGHTYEEAACVVKVPLGTLKRAQTRGLALLREHMEIAA
jgi:DNA-directed RNA polymerase specialized sigma24 family protein